MKSAVGRWKQYPHLNDLHSLTLTDVSLKNHRLLVQISSHVCLSPITSVYRILRALSPRREEWSAVCDVCLMFYFNIDFCHINQSAGPVHLTYSAIPNALTRPQTIYWGKKKRGLYFQLNLCSHPPADVS